MTLRSARTSLRLAPVLAALPLLAASPAAAVSGTRQTSSTVFDQQHPGRSTGTTLAIDYVNPNDPNGKPYAVQRTVTEFAGGSTIDTGVPQRCTASDAELVAQGAAACPPGSRVGSGSVVLDTGLPGGRNLENNVTLLNNKDQLILLIEPKGGGPRFVTRAAVTGRKIISDVPPLPGGPPDGFTAVKRVRLHTRPITVGGRNYATTPRTCSAAGWVNKTSFTYRDSVTQTVSNRSPCVRPPDRTAPRISLRGVKRCSSRPFVVHVSVHESGSGLAWAQLSLDGRRLISTHHTTFSRRIHPERLSDGPHRLSVTAQDRSGNRGRTGRTIFRCLPGGGQGSGEEDDDSDNDRVINQQLRAFASR